MKYCSAVIGSSFGDECKGNITHILASKSPSSITVRFNGGAQASHTVVSDGRRHSFRHFGSGTFAGAVTYLSEDFIVNPIAFSLERQKIVDTFNITPTEYVHPNCIVTTLWDIYINQVVETMRGEHRHGSVGMGINETVKRSQLARYKITVMDLLNPSILKAKLEDIKDHYVPERLKIEYNLSIDEMPEKYQQLFADREIIDMFMFFSKEFVDNVKVLESSVIERFDNVVFEGAQGLLLDQDNVAFWPYVTSSSTGIKNVMKVLNDIGYKDAINIHYLNRCYMTRHGQGYFPTEVFGKPYSKIEDLTNVTNEFQGALRFGILDMDLLTKAIQTDLKNLTVPANIFPTFTCVDQADDFVKYTLNGQLLEAQKELFIPTMSTIFEQRIDNVAGVYATTGLRKEDLILY